MQAIEEVRGGIRFEESNEVSVELVMRTPDDAMAMAAMRRWVPGLVQMEGYGNESLLANLVENLVVQAQGRIVSVSFSILESSMQELVSSLRAERQNDQ